MVTDTDNDTSTHKLKGIEADDVNDSSSSVSSRSSTKEPLDEEA